MLCVKCNADNKLKDRQKTRGRCIRCGHQFAFDPKITSEINFTDKFFQQTIEQLSVNSSLYFTDRQLYYFFNHRQNKKRADSFKRYAGCAIPVAIVLGFILAAATGNSATWLVPVVLIVPFAIAAIFKERFRQWLSGNQTQQLRTPPSQVAAWYARWSGLNKAPEKLLAPVSRSKPQLTGVNPELKNYSFDRAVICERDEIAQFLIANKFHFENNAAVLSINGYPDDIFDTVMEMLRRNPNLSVYAVHDASVQGVEMIPKLRNDPRWFAGREVKIYDLGLLPRQIMKRSVFVENRWKDLRMVTAEAAATLQPDEVTWLNRGNYVSLESFSPRVLLRVITNGIGKSRDPNAADALVPFETNAGFFYYYSYDTFG